MRLYAYPGNERLRDALAARLGVGRGSADWHRFPDGETLVRIDTPPDGEVCLVCTLDDPDPKILPLLFAADALRTQGATRVGLVAPYLAYMRQDKSFNAGEAVSSHHFSALLAQHFDWLVTVDPHLHRLLDLGEVFPRPYRVLHAAPLLGAWIQANVANPLLIGPDAESAQWVSAVAAKLGAPWTYLTKQRYGDLEVSMSLPVDAPKGEGRRPVLVDDIVSSGRTLAEAARLLKEQGHGAPWCVAVHGLFAGDARSVLDAAGFVCIAVTNTVTQPESVIDVTSLLEAGMQDLISTGT